tara:strand:- start:2483 stop:3088 length:606 start_codon:yes stop_codon:yes gene_type:complete
MNQTIYPKTNEIKSVKIVILGETSVGKSSMVLTLTNQKFSEFQESTIGAAFLTKKIERDNITINFEIWDTAGQERYHSLAPMYYRGARCAIVVYDMTNYNSFKKAKDWVIELQNSDTLNLTIAIAANKCDREHQRVVSYDEGKDYADSEGLFYIETSAKTNKNITELFEQLANSIPIEELENLKSRNNLQIQQNQKRGRCC